MLRRVALVGSILLAASVSVLCQTDERSAASVPLENYIKAHATGDPSFARKAFYVDGSVTSVRDGKYVSETFDAFIKRAFTGKPAVDEELRRDKRRIESIEIVGNAATAKIVLDYPAVKFIDLMTLLKIDGEWKIVNKTYFAEWKEKPKQ